MKPRGLTRYDSMLGYLVRLRRDDRVSWPKALAWTIAAYRTRFPSEAAYLYLARELERDARELLAQAARDRARQKRRAPMPGLTLPPALHVRVAPEGGGIGPAIRAEWMAKHTGGVSQRVAPPPRRDPAPAPISARIVKRAADSQPAPAPTAPEIDEAMPPLEDLAAMLPDAEPAHLLQPDAVLELAEMLNRRRL